MSPFRLLRRPGFPRDKPVDDIGLSPMTESETDSSTLSPLPLTSPHSDRSHSLGFSPIKHIASTYRIHTSTKPEHRKYSRLVHKDHDDVSEDDGEPGGPTSGMYVVDEETLISQEPRTRRGRFAALGIVCGISLLIVLLILNILVYVSQSAYKRDHDPDAIFSNWGLPGTGTSELAWYPTDFLRDVLPVPCHSHNDYWRKVPLFSALHAGCIGVEADVWMLDGHDGLLVGHNRRSLQPNRTLQSLYVDPIIELLTRQNTANRSVGDNDTAPWGVFDTSPNQTLILLIDMKTDGPSTFKRVAEQLEPLRSRGWLTTFKDGQLVHGPVTVVGTGNTPFDSVIANSTYRYIFFDAPLDKLENSNYDMTNSYYASVALQPAIGRVWFGALHDNQRQLVQSQLLEAHNRGLKARYWDLPSWPVSVRNLIWETLVSEGVDFLNVDDLRSATKLDWTKH